MLRYIQARLLAPISAIKHHSSMHDCDRIPIVSVTTSQQDILNHDFNTRKTLINDEDEATETTMMTGNFINLHCGHNNAFSQDERIRLQALIDSLLK
jgi:hypothetical protein